jgi:hypothetical protein
MDNLPYCPNCRELIPANGFAWICYRHKVRVKPQQPPPGPTTQKSRLDAAYPDAPPTQTETFMGDAVGELCKHFNDAQGKTCSSEACGHGPRDLQHSCPACPSCRLALPYHPNLYGRTITVTGPRAAGKTHYIVALNAWWENLMSRFDLQAMKVMKPEVEKAFDELSEAIRDKGVPATATIRGRVFSYAWQIARQGSALAPALLCTMPDVAGEDLLKYELLLTNQHYRFASGIVVLLDGDRLARALGLLEYQFAPGDHLKLIQAMTRYLQQQHGEDARQIPVAVCINKVDSLAALDPEWEQLVGNYNPRHDGEFDSTTCGKRSEAIEEILKGHPETEGIYWSVRNAFDNVMFFAVATMGSDGKEAAGRFRPLYVEDPFLWLMSCMGMVGWR